MTLSGKIPNPHNDVIRLEFMNPNDFELLTDNSFQNEQILNFERFSNFKFTEENSKNSAISKVP